VRTHACLTTGQCAILELPSALLSVVLCDLVADTDCRVARQLMLVCRAFCAAVQVQAPRVLLHFDASQI
jgi:hypothetical protein